MVGPNDNGISEEILQLLFLPLLLTIELVTLLLEEHVVESRLFPSGFRNQDATEAH